jgi:hypothetical protein
MGLCQNLFAQFLPATIANVNSGIALTPYNLNNDILDVGSDSYKVTTYTDITLSSCTGISWFVTYGTNNYADSINLSLAGPINNIYYADVVLVNDPIRNEVHALVAYYNCWYGLNSAWQVEDFIWDTTIKKFISAGVTTIDYRITGVSQGSAVNIDADDAENFVIVYDDGNSDVYAAAGSVSGGFSITTMPVSWSSLMMMPDICIGNNTFTNSRYVCVTSIGSVDGKLYIEESDLGSLLSGTPTVTTSTGPFGQTFGYYYYPRIAAPNSSNPSNDWTVVVQEDDRSTYKIYGLNSFNNTTFLTYNDGSLISGSGTDLTGIENLLPVVAYNADQKVWVGWNINNNISVPVTGGTNPAKKANFPIVNYCDEYAVPINTEYWVVPDNLNDYDEYIYLSLSSRHSSTTDLHLSYYNIAWVNRLFTKWVPAGIGSLRNAESFADDPSSIKNFLANFNKDEMMVINVYDLNGKLILSDNCTVNKVRSILEEKNNKLKSQSIYLVKLESKDGLKFFSDKFLSY